MTRWTTLALCLAACRPAPQQAAPQISCIDRQLAAKGLNQFGDPPDTLYAGGSPLFDEKSGRTMPRDQYVVQKHPEIGQACPPGDGG